MHGSGAKIHNIEAKIWFHIKEHKKAEYFSIKSIFRQLFRITGL